jgi:hypothetical protein
MLPESGGASADFVAALQRISADLKADRTCLPQVRDVSPPPVLCPGTDSLVRFLPLIDKTTLPHAGALQRLDGKSWRFVDLAAFEGADFAYAVSRSLLHRLPTEHEIEMAQSAEGRFRLLLAVDCEARRLNGPGRLIGLSPAKRLYRVLRSLEMLRLRPLAAAVHMLLDRRARRTFAKHHDRIAARRQLLASLVPPRDGS